MSTDLDEQKDRLLAKCRRLEKENRQLTVVVANSLIDWFSKQKNQLLIVIFANSRSFSLIHDAHSESEMQSSSSKKKFQTDDFLLTRVSLRVIRRFSFEHSRIFTSDENIVSTRFLYEQLTIFFNYSRISTNIFDDFIYLLAYLDEHNE